MKLELTPEERKIQNKIYKFKWWYSKTPEERKRITREKYLRSISYYSKYNRQHYQKEYMKEYHLNKKYNISLEEVNKILIQQENRCVICKSILEAYPSKNIHIDHNHETGKVRGILCRYCNVAIGFFKEDVTVLHSAINYLENSKIKR